MFINKKKYSVNNDEFNKIPHEEYNNLRILDKLGEFERIASLLGELGEELKIPTCHFTNPTHGGFLPIQCSDTFEKIYLTDVLEKHKENIEKNVDYHKIKKIFFLGDNELGINENEPSILFCENKVDLNTIFVVHHAPIILTKIKNPEDMEEIVGWNSWYDKKNIYQLADTEYHLFMPSFFSEKFQASFHYYLEEGQTTFPLRLNYDNLIHLCIMVKNGGPQFENMLKENLHLIDRWTILDTGSTDETLETIQKVLVDKKKGELFQEPFINFRDSRNRCLDLAGKKCKFILTLDDTYIVRGELRTFLNVIRGDQFADSYSVFIKGEDTQYASNRVIKAESNLRYIFRIHEVITDKQNINVIIPEIVHIEDGRFEYMEKRTHERKKLDLQLLFEEVEENPMEPRTYYYLAQTYKLMGDMEKAYYYYLKRAEFLNAGFVQERVDAIFEAARTANFYLNRPWSECFALYDRAFKADESRPDSLYFIGVHYLLEGDKEKAFPYLKRAFYIGFPTHCQYSLKPTLSFYHLPKILAKICYELEEYEVGLESARFFLQKNSQAEMTQENVNDYQEILSWYSIYEKLNIYRGHCTPKEPEKPLFCFVADGGFGEPWSGRTILTKGVGGSETYIIEMARYIQKTGYYQVIVFCNCLEEENFEGVIYKPIPTYYEFVNTNIIDHCIISRYSEYLPVTFKGWTENVYLVVHDLSPSGIVIPHDKKLKNIFCLTEWHVSYFTNIFPSLKSITVPFYYGIDSDKFRFQNNTTIENNTNNNNYGIQNNDVKKIPYKFVYSSFPNRGLLVLLQLWPAIIEIQPEASLHIYCNLDQAWVNNFAKEQMTMIKQMLEFYKNMNHYHVYSYGWVDKQTLANAWLTADIWFYPCIFMETFCLTALEAALSKTLVISNHLAALENTVGDRGVIVKGDPSTDEWKQRALAMIEKFIKPNREKEMEEEKQRLIEKNFAWASELSWKNQAEKLLKNYILPRKIKDKGVHLQIHDKEEMNKTMSHLFHYFNNEFTKEGLYEPVRILEIGTYTGITLIHMLDFIKHSIGFGLDNWENRIEKDDEKKKKYMDKLYNHIEENQIEKSFYKNVSDKELQKRIRGIKGDSTVVLTEMLKRKEYYDLIYIDGSDKENDFTSDLILSWQILNKGGYIVTCYSKEKERPLKSFQSKFTREVELNSKNQFVFLYKKK